MGQAHSESASRIESLEREVIKLKMQSQTFSYDREKLESAMEDFLALREEVSLKWRGNPSVLEEMRKDKRHG